MAYLAIDSALLQRIRLEIAAQPEGAPRFDNLSGVGPDRLRIHIERLFYGGEIAATCRVTAGGLDLTVQRLTPYGILAMHAGLTRARAPRQRP